MITKDCRLIKWLKHFSLKSLQTAKLLTTISQLRQLCFFIPFPFLNNSTWTLFSCLPNFYLSLLQLFPFYWQFVVLSLIRTLLPSLSLSLSLMGWRLPFILRIASLLNLPFLSLLFWTYLHFRLQLSLASPSSPQKRTFKFWTICKAFYWFV